ncbi:hypothetical protein CVT25_003598 [Psilocybe cyanescens]|uniref:Uncharacterized protein n=1 Tax=Psilocybe cyanescens TaxID=93625 RepID=A0A409WZW8_PSICY|nr:hypothetical protein CVT25_003598 [Psilocybe cyanescens]
MPATRTKDESDRRPTLPSIHTLNLPLLSGPAGPNVSYQNHNNLQRISNHAGRHARNFSTSSSVTNESRNNSPSPSPNVGENPANPFASGRPVRLRACTLEEADAIIFVGPATEVPQKSNYAPRQFKEPSMLIFGPNVDDYRKNPRPIAKGSRIHPYRIVRSPSPTINGRRSSVVTITPLPMPHRRL